MPPKKKTKTTPKKQTRRASSFRLTPPKKSTFWIAVVVAALGAVALLPFVGALTFPWLSPILFFVAFLLLLLGLLVKGF
jgi:fatty acid desaturase